MKSDDRPDETIDSGMGILQSRGTDPALEFMLADTMMDRRTMGVDASTGQNHWFGPRGGVRPRQFGYDMINPICDAPPPPTPRSLPGPDFISQQQANLTADLLVTVAWLQSEVHTLNLASPALPKPATWTQLAWRRSVTFTFRGVSSWDQYRHVFDAIVRSNGWDDDTSALQLLSHLEGECAECTGGGGSKSRTDRVGQCTE